LPQTSLRDLDETREHHEARAKMCRVSRLVGSRYHIVQVDVACHVKGGSRTYAASRPLPPPLRVCVATLSWSFSRNCGCSADAVSAAAACGVLASFPAASGGSADGTTCCLRRGMAAPADRHEWCRSRCCGAPASAGSPMVPSKCSHQRHAASSSLSRWARTTRAARVHPPMQPAMGAAASDVETCRRCPTLLAFRARC